MSFHSEGGEKWRDGQADLKIPILMSLPLDALGDFFLFFAFSHSNTVDFHKILHHQG